MSQHILDNPIWNALTSGNKNLAKGNEEVKHYDHEVAIFAAIPAMENKYFIKLSEVYESDQGPILFSTEDLPDITPWKLSKHTPGHQMVYKGDTLPKKPESTIVPLDKQHVPQMLALTEKTAPGPFFKNTIAFGNYIGIFDKEQLVAMAGFRFHTGDYIEISAVCTDPDYRGKGYGAQLMNQLIIDIKAMQKTPYLHVVDTNINAIELYKKLGFYIRSHMNFYSINQ